MITIYCSTPYWLKGNRFDKLEVFSEAGLLELVKEDENQLWIVQPHSASPFRTKFIEPTLTNGGYVREGIYRTTLCGKIVVYRVVVDINIKIVTHEQDTRY